eukprot:UN25413
MGIFKSKTKIKPVKTATEQVNSFCPGRVDFFSPKPNKRKYNEYNLSPVKDVPGGIPHENERDYCILFKKNMNGRLGFQMCAGMEDKNAFVVECWSGHAKQKVAVGSMVLSVNGRWLVEKTFDEIESIMCEELLWESDNPEVQIRFRALQDTIDKVQPGTLLLQVFSAHELLKKATHAVITVDGLTLTTEQVKKSKHCRWTNVLRWKNFNPLLTRTANIALWETTKTSSKCFLRWV